jgi:hypothetical protein
VHVGPPSSEAIGRLVDHSVGVEKGHEALV